MKKGLASVLMAVIFTLVFSASFCWAGEREELLRELEFLKGKIEQLERRISELEAKGAEAQKGTEEVRKELKVISEALKGMEFGFSATGLALGTVGNGENDELEPTELRKDRVDGAGKISFEVSKEVLEGGRATAVLEAVQGGRTSERVPCWWGVEDVVGGYEEDPKVSLSELWYEQELFDGRLIFTLGKIDLSAYFDANEVAGDETSQFLSPGFVHSVAIEFPDDNGPGVRLQFIPSELWDLSFGWGEADADWDELGKEPFLMGEVAFHPKFRGLQGNYRFYGWYREKRGDEARGWKGDDEEGWGFGLSADQAVAEGLSVFVRVGYQNEELYEFDWAWSLGAELGGCYWGREEDALGVAFGMALLSEDYEDVSDPWISEDEAHLELYYRLQINDHLSLSPDLQVIWNAQGDDRFDPVTVLGLRGTVEF